MYDPAGTAQVLDANGNVTTPGTRIQEIILDNGTDIVSGGTVVSGPDVTIATIDFLTNGGDQYPFRGAAFTRVGVISAAQYPEVPVGGGSRITTVP